MAVSPTWVENCSEKKKKNHFSEGSYFFLKKKLAINLECHYYRLFFRADRLVAMGCS